MNAPSKAAGIFFLKLLVTIGFLWWLSRYFDFNQIRDSLSNVNPIIVLFAVILHVSAYLLGGVRWWLLFQHLTGAIPLRQVMPSYYLGVFFNNVLPSAYGGDLARSARLYISGLSGSALASSALMDRLLGLSAVIMMGGVALFLSPQNSIYVLAWPVLGSGVVVLAAATAIVIVPDWAKMLDSSQGQRWPRLHAVLANFPRYRANPGLLLKGFLLSVLNQGFVVAVYIMVASDLGLEVPLFQFVVVLTLMFLISSLPVSLGGLGPREGVMMALLLPLGVDSSLVLTLSIVYLIVLWCSALPGAFVLLLGTPRSMGDNTRSV